MTCPNYVSSRLLTVARRGSCRLTRKLILLRLVGDVKKFLELRISQNRVLQIQYDIIDKV